MVKFFIILIAITHSLFAQTTIREYTYSASENESKSQAKQSALLYLQREAIEENGVKVDRILSKKVKQSNKLVKKEISVSLNTYSKTLTKVKILDESYDGKKFYIKIEISVDEETIEKETSLELEKLSLKSCDEVRQRVAEYAYDISDQKKLDKFVDFITLYPINEYPNKCYSWHKDVLMMDFKSQKYSLFLQKYINTSDESIDAELAYQIINFLKQNGYMNSSDEILKLYSKVYDNGFSYYLEKVFEIDGVDVKSLYTKIIELSSKSLIGRPAAFKEKQTILMIEKSLRDADNTLDFYVEFVQKYNQELKKQSKYFKYLLNRYTSLKNEKIPSKQLLNIIIKDLDNNKLYISTFNVLYRNARRQIIYRKQFKYFLDETVSQLKQNKKMIERGLNYSLEKELKNIDISYLK